MPAAGVGDAGVLIWRSFAAFQTDAGSTRRRQRGAIAGAVRRGGPTIWKQLGCAPPVSGLLMFRAALKSRRAILPCDAFYEWQTMPGGAKEPFAIARRDGSPLALAGIWESYKGPEEETTHTFAIMTTTANATMSFLHERMPVILEPETWPTWLDGPDEDALSLMQPAADTVLRLWPVSTQVNAVRNNGPHLLDRVPGETALDGGLNPE